MKHFLLIPFLLLAAAACEVPTGTPESTRSYSVTYLSNLATGGTVPVDTARYAKGALVTVSTAGSLTKTGAQFAGWNTKPDGTGTAYAAGAVFVMPAANVILYARWSLVPVYLVTYLGNGATGGTVPVDSGVYGEGASVTVVANTFTKSGYTFAGWNTKPDGTGTAYAAGDVLAMPAANVALYARWSLGTGYVVTYSGNGATGGTVPLDTGTYGEGASVMVAANTLTKSGYTFAGWNTKADGTGTAFAAGVVLAMPAANVILYARWSLGPVYSVTYSGNGATGGTVPLDAKAYVSGASVTVAANTLTKSGYIFAGWNTKADGTGTAYAAGVVLAMPAANVTFYARWNPVPVYSVTYSDNGATGGTVPLDAKTYVSGASVTVAANTLTKSGYTFAGWNTKADGTGTAYAAGVVLTMPAANVTFYARWNPVPVYSVTYSDNGSTGGTLPVDAKTFVSGASVTVAANTLTKSGYTFAGWNTKADGTGTTYAAGASYSMPPANLTLYAGWSPIRVTGVSLSSTSLTLYAGDSPTTLTAAVSPADAADPSVVWQSSNTKAATVVGGVVTPLDYGFTTISATTADGNKVAVCQVTVLGSSVSISISFDLAPYQSLAFPSVPDQPLGASILITPSISFDPTQGTNWRWIVNGVLQTEATSSDWTFTPASPGFYTVYATVTHAGVLYSGSFHVTVTQ